MRTKSVFKKLQHTFVLVLITLLLPLATGAQTIKVGQAIYRSDDDGLLTIQKISLLPVIDNVDGIYSRPVEKALNKALSKNHHWDLVDPGAVGPILSPEDLEADPNRVKQMYSNTGTDALISARVTKGPNGISIKLGLFLAGDGKLLAREETESYKRFEIDAVNNQAKILLKKVIGKIPYVGLVMSRQGNRVTVNLGKQDGITKNQIVTVIQIIKATRHPKFGFLISTEKEVLGKIKLLKVDDTLSFGKIVTEKEPDAIQRYSKISGIDFVSYKDTDSLTKNTSEEDSLMQRPDGKITFGKSPESWVPKKPPTFGEVGAYLGLGNYSASMTSNGKASTIYPSINIEGEIWMTPTWTVHGRLRQAIISEGDNLNISVSSYDFLMGYNFRIDDTLWGPNVEMLGGYSTYTSRSDSDDFPTMTYNGMKFGIQGGYPVTDDRTWRAGARLYFHFNPSITESPATGRAEDGSTINLFGIFAAKRLGVNMKVTGRFDYELFSTSFTNSGSAGVASSSQKHMSFSAGVNYMF